MSRNAEVAALLEEMADRLEATGVEYKPRAYRQAADNIRNHTVAIETLAERGQDAVEDIDRVGDAISSKVVEYFETGAIPELEELREELPVDIVALTKVEGVGPKTVGDLYEALGIQDLDDLEAAAEAGEIQEVKGFGAKTEQNILENIPFARQSHERQLLGDAIPLAERVMDHLAAHEAVEQVDTAGSLRRWRATIGDVDVLVASTEGETVVDHFVDFDADTIEAGTSKASLRSNGIRVDLRVVVPEEWGAALQYFTGSRDHNIRLRNLAIEREMKVNEYGVFDVSGVDDPDSGQRVGERVGGETEESMYAALDLPLIPPEMREDRGELDAAAAGELPDLIEEGDVRGDLHLHTDWSDGHDTIAEMVTGAAEFGHDYIAISDHATGPGMVGGVGVEDEGLIEQAEEVRAVAEDAPIRVFTGVEANIAPDGSISVADDVLAELDCVVASPHASLDGDGTERLVAACEHPDVNILGHPTGRLLNQREGLDIDIDAVAEAAAANDTALEINANPHRLDLRGQFVKAAIEAGATIAIDTDAHTPSSYGFVRYGVHTARRGWAEAVDVLNTRDADGVAEFLGV
ncbi:DNA polymerase/3'-5' exonuclease PolX [Halorarius litoreus]|uniref:DNA polymerase/3'-5' exonuclease PolX n=1 Tax=Halorarius litoreus TaxID=2962676 RepID=UPI0020CE1EA0|nr:DNA polymerase/3'-5' exonuclease PolX [Halorarius litoreus]